MVETFFLLSFGCKINQYEGHRLKEKFLQLGLEEAETAEDADVCIINTCTVTARADQKVRRLLRKLHEANPEGCLIVTGCYGSAREDREELERIPGVKFVVSNREKLEIPRLYAEYRGIPYVENKALRLSPFSLDRSRAYLKVQDGCNLMCSFCKIPYVRNQLTSKPPEEVVREAEEYVAAGFREIVLTGVHLGLYGFRVKENRHEYTIPHLLEKLCQIPGLERIRLSSIEVNEITSELVEVAKTYSDKICPHFHLPLQSGHNRILELMKRKYTVEQFLETVAMLKTELEEPGFTTDIIYGFPTETWEEFEGTLEVVEKVGFHRVHAFPFSPRRRTPAYRLEPKVPPVEIRRRKKVLLEVSEKVSLQEKRKRVGKRERVLLEHRLSPRGEAVGYTERYFRCYMPHAAQWRGRIVMVEVLEVYEDGLKGVRVKETQPLSCNLE